MKVSLHLSGLLLLLHLSCGCERSPEASVPEAKPEVAAANPAPPKPDPEKEVSQQQEAPLTAPATAVVETVKPNEAEQYNAEYEKWKIRAVEEFPDIGVAGSRFNQQFLLEAKKLRETNAPELAHSNWPYLLALQVNTLLERSKSSQPAQPSSAMEIPPRNNNPLPPQPRPPLPNKESASERFGTYDVADLKNMEQLPKGGVFKGTITRVERQVASGDLDVIIILDGLLYCEVNLDRNTAESRTDSGYYSPSYYYRGSSKNSTSLEVIQEQNSLKLVEKQSASSRSVYTGKTYTQTGRRDILTLSVGQTISVEGMLLLKANKKPLLKGIIKRS